MTLAKFANSLTRLPLALIQVFTWDKSFKTNPIIGNRLLNRLGLHVARLVVSHLFFNFRLALLAPAQTPVCIPRQRPQQSPTIALHDPEKP